MKKPRSKQNNEDSADDDDNEFLIENLKNASIEIRGEGYLDKGKIMDIREGKNDVTITYKSRWGEITQLSLYFDEFQEIKESGKCSTMDGDIHIII